MASKRVKDAGFLQLHIEKVLLAGGAIVFVLAAVLFLLGNPFALVVNNQAYPKAQDAVDLLVRNDDLIERGLGNQKPFDELPPIPNYQLTYEQERDQPITSGSFARRYTAGGLTPNTLDPDEPVPPRYATATPPVPTKVIYKFGTDVLDTGFEPNVVKAYFDLWGGPRDPADFSMFIAAGEFDIWEWAKRLQADPSDSSLSKIPSGIWSSRFGVAAVALLREEWDPAKNDWVDRQIVKPLPGQARVMPTDEAPSEPLRAFENITLLRGAQEQIARPELPWLDNFQQAMAPGGDTLGEGGEGFNEFGLALEEGNLGPAEIKIKELEEKIQQLEERKQEREDRRRPAGPARGPGPGDLEGDRPTRGGGEREDPAVRSINRNIERLNEQIQRLQPKAEAEQRKREELIRERERRASERAGRESALRPGFDNELGGVGAEGGVQLQENQTVRVWAADPTMQPGKTYRYKLIVAAINPLYAVPRLEPDQLDENKSRASLMPSEKEIQDMEWIGPITVEPESRFFFARGSAEQARVDVFRRISGVLEKKSFDVTPGDPIGGVVTIKGEDEFDEERTVDLSVDAILIDIERRRSLTGGNLFTMIYMDSQGNLFEKSQTSANENSVLSALEDEIEDGPEWALRPKGTESGGGPGDFEDF